MLLLLSVLCADFEQPVLLVRPTPLHSVRPMASSSMDVIEHECADTVQNIAADYNDPTLDQCFYEFFTYWMITLLIKGSFWYAICNLSLSIKFCERTENNGNLPSGMSGHTGCRLEVYHGSVDKNFGSIIDQSIVLTYFWQAIASRDLHTTWVEKGECVSNGQGLISYHNFLDIFLCDLWSSLL